MATLSGAADQADGVVQRRGYSSIRLLRSRPSVYRRAALYAALVTTSV